MKRFNSDRGDAILTTFICSILLVFLISSLTIDIVKNSYVKENLNSIAQQAVTSSVAYTDSSGFVTKKSLENFIKVYKEDRGLLATKSTERAKKKDLSFISSPSCPTVEVNGKKVKVPYVKFTLDTERRIGTNGVGPSYAFSLAESERDFTIPDIPSGYKVISAEVYETSRNDNVVTAFASSQGDGNSLLCQVYKTKVSATTFLSDRDTVGR